MELTLSDTPQIDSGLLPFLRPAAACAVRDSGWALTKTSMCIVYTVEASIRGYSRKLCGGEERWAIAGLLRDHQPYEAQNCGAEGDSNRPAGFPTHLKFLSP